MSYDIKCDQCGTKISASIEMIGYEMHCGTCGGSIVVPLTNFTAGMVSGNYWIQKSMGRGNISETFIAKRVSENDKVFLKILSPCVTLVHEHVEQFMIEMCRSHQIEHPNLISVYETGKMNGHYYLATRFVEGECLDKRIERTGPMSEKEALRLCLKIARILRTCWHDYGIVHRAIKPSNILVNDAGEVFLLDVGNCKHLLLSDQVTLERMDNLGTLADFMSPEEAQGVLEVDCSSDIYSLGATLFYLMTGTKPYTGSDTTQVLLKHLNAPTPSINQRSDDVSRETAKFIRAMMDSDPDNRVYSWREVVGKLKQLLKNKTRGSITDKVLKTHVGLSTDTDEGMQTTVMQPPPQPSNGALKFAIIAMTVIILLGIIGVIAIVVSQDSGTPSTPGDGGTTTQTAPEGTTTKPTPPKNEFDTKFEALVNWYKNRPADKAKILKKLSALKSEARTHEQRTQCSNLEAVLNGKGSIDDVYNTRPNGSSSTNGSTTTNPPAGGDLMKADSASLTLDGKNIPFPNNGFDSGSLKPWVDKSFGGGKASVTSGGAQAGTYALQLTSGANCIYVFNAPKGKDFGDKNVTFQGFAKIKESRKGFLDVIAYGSTGSQLSIKSAQVDSKTYKQYKVDSKLPKGTTKFVLRFRY